MFRGFHYVTMDYMLYVQDGWITFAYWKPQFVYEKVKASQMKNAKGEAINLPNSNVTSAAADSIDSNPPKKEKKTIKFHVMKRTARLNVCLCNFQLHYYNSWKLPEKQNNKEQPAATEAKPANNSLKSNFLHSNSIVNFISSNFNLASLNLISSQNHNDKNNNISSSNNNGNITNGNVEDDPNVAATAASTSANATATVNASASSTNYTEDLMQLFSVVNFKFQKVTAIKNSSSSKSLKKKKKNHIFVHNNIIRNMFFKGDKITV